MIHESVFKCAECGSGYTHHETVEVFSREGEDKGGVRVFVHADRAKFGADTNMDGNPSARRGGIAIRFSCEECTAHTLLEIAQHKGETFITARPDEVVEKLAVGQ